eukprot:TRINITY_DN10944_c0_g1_i1.p1 TRINITY_DN10944_c0_g1~~TRINITY_DN10944_c0_g1_i1.p1  ORF type:complete len:396 (-),score=33.25 TRINITY_DN10944_c0_g1_i1:11-1162(-)
MAWQVDVLFFTVFATTSHCKVSVENGEFRLIRNGVRKVLRSEVLPSSKIVQHVGNIDRDDQTVEYASDAGQRHARAQNVVSENGRTSFIRSNNLSAGSGNAAQLVAFPTGNWQVINMEGSCENALFRANYYSNKSLYLNPAEDDDLCNRWNPRTVESCKVCCEKDKRCQSVDWYHDTLTCNLYSLPCVYANTTNTHHSPSSFRLDRCAEHVKAFGWEFVKTNGRISRLYGKREANVAEAVKILSTHCPDVYVYRFGKSKAVDEACAYISANCGSVTSINAPESDITDVGVARIASGCPRLRRLGLEKTKITDRALVDMSKNCQFLEWLNCKNTRVSNAGWKAIFERCPKLRAILYSVSDTVTEAFMKLLMEEKNVSRGKGLGF